MIDIEIIKRIAKMKGIRNIGYAEKDYFQEIILLGVSRETPDIVFKGGTALYKLYGLNRFSEDLDFSGKIEEREMYIFSTYLRDFGYRNEVSIKKVPSGLLLTFIIEGFLYQGTSESLARVRVDINEESESILETEWSMFFSLYPDIPSFRIGAMPLQEIMAEKIRALLVRKKARDAYDIWFLLKKGVKIDAQMVKKKLGLYNLNLDPGLLDEALYECRKRWKRELRPMIADLPEIENVENSIRTEITSC